MKKKRVSLFDIIVHIISAVLLIIVLYPLILVVSNSVSDANLVASGQIVLFPKGFNLKGYEEFFKDKNIMTGYANSIFYTVVGTCINLVVTVPAAYALTKNTLPGKSIFTTMIMIIMYFSGGLIPTFLVLNRYGLYNTRLVLLLWGAFSTYNCIICRSFFSAMPKDLEEAAELDGCSPMRTFIQIILPLSKALLGVMVLYFGVSHWNAYFNAMIYIRDDSKQPLQVFLRRILVLAQTAAISDGEIDVSVIDREYLLRYSTIVVASLPLMILYPFLQKYFDKGVMIGSVKG
ncbi:MAG: carbohydrate ABC transporter permease [Lachnospiraceae bacterium]|nr:carbohydrate ABC transporter permease [Lachnospiraceae bacterium]